jgi:hypothetical protein
MKLIYLPIIVLISLGVKQAKATNTDSLKTKPFIKQSIIPLSLIISGSIISNSQFEKHLQNTMGGNLEFKIDEYLPYAPIAELYIADILGVKSKNHWFDQTKYLFISNLIASSITYGLKKTINKTRPNDLSYGFPSGHTTIAFTNAAVLHNEFNENAPFLAYSGYAFATATGVFRVINNEHWVSDVLVGAGIGILAANLVYYMEPFKNFNPFKKSKNISFSPYINQNRYGIYFSYSIPSKS